MSASDTDICAPSSTTQVQNGGETNEKCRGSQSDDSGSQYPKELHSQEVQSKIDSLLKLQQPKLTDRNRLLLSTGQIHWSVTPRNRLQLRGQFGENPWCVAKQADRIAERLSLLDAATEATMLSTVSGETNSFNKCRTSSETFANASLGNISSYGGPQSDENPIPSAHESASFTHYQSDKCRGVQRVLGGSDETISKVSSVGYDQRLYGSYDPAIISDASTTSFESTGNTMSNVSVRGCFDASSAQSDRHLEELSRGSVSEPGTFSTKEDLPLEAFVGQSLGTFRSYKDQLDFAAFVNIFQNAVSESSNLLFEDKLAAQYMQHLILDVYPGFEIVLQTNSELQDLFDQLEWNLYNISTVPSCYWNLKSGKDFSLDALNGLNVLNEVSTGQWIFRNKDMNMYLFVPQESGFKRLDLLDYELLGLLGSFVNLVKRNSATKKLLTAVHKRSFFLLTSGPYNPLLTHIFLSRFRKISTKTYNSSITEDDISVIFSPESANGEIVTYQENKFKFLRNYIHLVLLLPCLGFGFEHVSEFLWYLDGLLV